MPRRSSAGRSAFRAAPSRAPTRRRNPAPRQAPISTARTGDAVNRSSRPAHREDDYVTRPRSRSPSSGPSIFGTIVKAGIAYCVVRTLAHAMSPRPVPVAAETVSSATNAAALSMLAAFQYCVNANSNDVGKCQFYMDMLSKCRKNSGSKPQVTN